jgi:ring-1,2-phenylacetyl-CoA epoxidase subunit PaaE
MTPKDSIRQTYNLQVIKVVKETKDATSLYFDTKGKSQEFNYKSGQHLILHFTIDGRKVSRAYSLFTAPFENKLGITVKRVKGGLMSNYINDNITVGDAIELSIPRGNFCLNDEEKAKAYYFFGGGSGITPLLSIIKNLLYTKPKSKIFFLYGNRDEASIIHYEALEHLKKQFPNRFHIEHELESEGGFFGKGLLSNLLQARTGWVDKRRVLYFLKDNPTDLAAEYFICGPSPMMHKVEEALTEISILPENIHIERFSSDPDASHSENSIVNIKNAELTYTINGIMKKITIQGNKTLFESLSKVGEDIPHSCLAGSCASCACRITKGNVNMKQCFGLNSTQLKDGFILSCQAIPQTNRIEVNFDGI